MGDRILSSKLVGYPRIDNPQSDDAGALFAGKEMSGLFAAEEDHSLSATLTVIAVVVAKGGRWYGLATQSLCLTKATVYGSRSFHSAISVSIHTIVRLVRELARLTSPGSRDLFDEGCRIENRFCKTNSAKTNGYNHIVIFAMGIWDGFGGNRV
jgi:hypothetical protein